MAKNAVRVPRPPRNPSPYTRYNKSPWKYGRVGDHTQPNTDDVIAELAKARVFAAAYVETLLADLTDAEGA